MHTLARTRYQHTLQRHDVGKKTGAHAQKSCQCARATRLSQLPQDQTTNTKFEERAKRKKGSHTHLEDSSSLSLSSSSRARTSSCTRAAAGGGGVSDPPTAPLGHEAALPLPCMSRSFEVLRPRPDCCCCCCCITPPRGWCSPPSTEGRRLFVAGPSPPARDEKGSSRGTCPCRRPALSPSGEQPAESLPLPLIPLPAPTKLEADLLW